ncbi:MAG: MFS transporter [Chloroflexi bacterium]|nr:MFS transporter [Chloroflexota bacterium]
MADIEAQTIKAASATSGWRQTFSSLGYRDFRLLWIGMLGHSGSLWMEAIARNWLIWEMTHSGVLLGVVNLMRAIPMLTIGPLAGVLADRLDKRRLLLISQMVTLITKLVLAVLITTGLVEVWHVLATAFVAAIAMSFNQPARQSLIPSLVGKETLMNAVALNSAAMNFTRILGPSVAGALIPLVGVDGAYYFAATVYIGVLVVTFLMKVPANSYSQGKATSLWGDMAVGFRFVGRQRTILSLLILSLVPMVFGMPYMSLLPIFADKVLNIGVSGYGILQSATGAGALLGSLTMASRGDVRRQGWVTLGAVFFFGASLVVFSTSLWLPLSLLAVAVAGYMNMVFRATTNASLLTRTPPSLQGRVMSLYLLDSGLMPLGSVAAGTMADAFNAPFALGIMGSVVVVLALCTAALVPSVRRLEASAPISEIGLEEDEPAPRKRFRPRPLSPE